MTTQRFENRRSGMQHLMLAASLTASLSLLTGCVEQSKISVVMKPDVSAATETASDGSAAATGYGTFVGVLKFDGTAPTPAVLLTAGDAKVKTEDREVCAPKDMLDESLLVDPASLGIANAIVYLEKKPGSIQPELAAVPTEPAVFDQANCRFKPHVLLTRVGQEVMVMSDDPIAHNTHTYPARNNPLNTGVKPKAREADAVRFKYTKPEGAPLEVKCDYHTWMRAYHFPVDHPYASMTNAAGEFRIAGLPEGEHEISVWHERAAGGGSFLKRKIKVKITANAETTEEIKVSATDFR